MDLADGEHAVWSSTLHSPWVLYLGIRGGRRGLVVASGTNWWLADPGGHLWCGDGVIGHLEGAGQIDLDCA